MRCLLIQMYLNQNCNLCVCVCVCVCVCARACVRGCVSKGVCTHMHILLFFFFFALCLFCDRDTGQ